MSTLKYCLHFCIPISFNNFLLLIALSSKFILYMEAHLCEFFSWECSSFYWRVFEATLFDVSISGDERLTGMFEGAALAGVGGLLGNKASGGVRRAVYSAQRSVGDTELQFHLAVGSSS